MRDSGGRRVLPLGAEVVVTLDENPSTGYRWEVDDAEFDRADPVLRQIGDDYTGGVAPTGSGGTRRLVFQAVRAGSIRLRLAHRRPWEPAAVAAEFEVVLDVRPA